MLPGFNGQLENEVLALVDELLRVHPHLLRQVSELENKTSKLMRGGGGCQRGSLPEKSPDAVSSLTKRTSHLMIS